jgi:hypothetical protein
MGAPRPRGSAVIKRLCQIKRGDQAHLAHLKHSAIALDLGHQINSDAVRPHEEMREGIIQKAEVIVDEYKVKEKQKEWKTGNTL